MQDFISSLNDSELNGKELREAILAWIAKERNDRAWQGTDDEAPHYNPEKKPVDLSALTGKQIVSHECQYQHLVRWPTQGCLQLQAQ